MDEASMLDASNRSMLARTVASIAQIDSMIEGYVAQDEVIAERQKVITQQLKEVEYKREKIKDTISSAQASKRALESAAESLRGLLSPIRSLPVEILFRIFYILSFEEEKRRRTRMQKWCGFGVARTPYVLGRVCSQWRTIVNQSLRLWDTILFESVSFRNGRQEHEEKMARQRITQYLSRGIQSKQSLFLDTWDESGIKAMISLIGSHAAPWKSIEIAVGFDAQIQNLRAIEVTLYRCTRLRSLECFMPLMQNASSITIMGTPPSWGLDPWSSLVSLEIRPWVTIIGQTIEPLNFNSAQLSQLLNAAPNLEVLSLSFATADDSHPNYQGTVQTVVHGAIKDLSLHLHHLEPSLAPFGVKIASPLLYKLTILSFDHYWILDGGTSIEWDHLKFLSFCKIDGNHLMRALHLLHRLPTVETLELQGIHVNELINLAQPSPQDPLHPPTGQLLPRLTKLIMHETDIQGGTLIDVLSRRLEGGEQGLWALESIDLYENTGVSPQDWERIQGLLESGRLHNATRVGGGA